MSDNKTPISSVISVTDKQIETAKVYLNNAKNKADREYWTGLL